MMTTFNAVAVVVVFSAAIIAAGLVIDYKATGKID